MEDQGDTSKSEYSADEEETLLQNGPNIGSGLEQAESHSKDFGDLPQAPEELHELEDTEDEHNSLKGDGEEEEVAAEEEEEEEEEVSHMPDHIPYPSSHITRDPNPELPETVTTLHTHHGSTVYVVGTAHFSENSQEDVTKTIEAVQPDVVVMELCSNRVNILHLDEDTLMEEAKSLNMWKIQTAIKQSGMVQGLMRILLLSLSAHLTKELGMAPGGEFRRAFKEAQKIPGCRVHLGDRPIQITLQRTFGALNPWQKLRLAWYLIMSKEPISKEEVEKCKKRDLLEEVLREMAGEFPALSQVLVKERDMYLANAIRLASQPVPSPRSDTGFVPATVVGVVGMGHVPGIVDYWEKDISIKELMTVPKGSMFGTVTKWTLRIAMLGLLSWSCYHAAKVSWNFFYRPAVEDGTCPAPKFPGL